MNSRAETLILFVLSDSTIKKICFALSFTYFKNIKKRSANDVISADEFYGAAAFILIWNIFG